MSRPRSRSPHYRKFPWEESSFDHYKGLSEFDKDRQGRRPGPGEGPEERFRGRSPHFSDNRALWKQHSPNQEFFHRRPSPHHDGIVHDNRRFFPSRGRGGYGDRGRGGYGDRGRGGYGDRGRGGFHSHSFENRGRSPHSLPKLMRERLPSMPLSDSDHKQRDSERGNGWMRDQQDRGPGRFRDLSPGGRSDDQRGRRNTQGPNRDRHREDSHREWNPPFKRHRRQMDDGFRTGEDFMDQRYPVDSPRDSFGGDVQKGRPHGDTRHSGPFAVERDHGSAPDRKRYDDRRHPDFDRQRSPPAVSSSQERFTASHNRFDDREGARRPHPQGNWREAKYSEGRCTPTSQDETNSMGCGSQEGPMNHRDRGSPLSTRGSFGRGHGGRPGPNRNHHQSQRSPQGYQGPPHEERRQDYRPFRSDNGNHKEEAGWTQENRPQWKADRSGSLNRPVFKTRVDSTVPCARQRGWTEQKSTAAKTEETLTIKVDMSQPLNQSSSPCYSSDRQLSLDLVNVGRQRLDFLPMLEHSGTYQETSTHTGTFAQEIISLVHYVKEQYFRDAGVTLNERFSAPPTEGPAEAETEELTLDQRFSSNRGISLEIGSLMEEDEPPFSRLAPLQPVRGPGDLRHDLERRRQERLEGVKVTISGNSKLQRPQASFSDSPPDHNQGDELGLMEDEGSNWTREGNMRPLRGMSYRHPGFQRGNNRFNTRFRPMRR